MLEVIGDSTERFRICEISGSFAFNGFLTTAFGSQALIDVDIEAKDLTPSAIPKEVRPY